METASEKGKKRSSPLVAPSVDISQCKEIATVALGKVTFPIEDREVALRHDDNSQHAPRDLGRGRSTEGAVHHGWLQLVVGGMLTRWARDSGYGQRFTTTLILMCKYHPMRFLEWGETYAVSVLICKDEATGKDYLVLRVADLVSDTAIYQEIRQVAILG